VRLICFLIVTPWEIGVILTANYTFLNYLVLSLGFLLLDDKFLRRVVPLKYEAARRLRRSQLEVEEGKPPLSIFAAGEASVSTADIEPRDTRTTSEGRRERFSGGREEWRERIGFYKWAAWMVFSVVMLTWIFYATTAEMIGLPLREMPLPVAPIAALDPFRIANQYGLFAVMTRGRYEIEFQGSDDGENWTAYPFRNKPQAINEAPRIYAPYQPRFDWNLMVRLAREMAAERACAADGRAIAGEFARCSRAVQGESVSADSASLCARGAMAVLVYFAGR
jgi:hypothetical protein